MHHSINPPTSKLPSLIAALGVAFLLLGWGSGSSRGEDRGKTPSLGQDLSSYRVQNPTVYSIELTLEGAGAKDKMEKMSNFRYDTILNPLGTMLQTPENPTIYALARVKGQGVFVLPERIKEADDRKVIITFAAPYDWAGSDFTVEVWKDKSASDKFWRAVLSSITFEAAAGASVKAKTPVHPAIPVEASGGANARLKISVDGHTWEGIELVGDKLLAQCEGKVPEKGSTTKVDLLTTISTWAGRSKPLGMGHIVLENHGRVE